MVANRHQTALRIITIDAASGVGDNHRLDSHAREGTGGKCDFFRGIAFVEMYAALHAGHWDIADIADDETSGVADGGGVREIRDFGVGNFGCAFGIRRRTRRGRSRARARFWEAGSLVLPAE